MDLGDNKIGAEGARAMAQGLATNTTLTSMDLSTSGVGAEGARALAQVLATNTTLTSMDLGDNEIGDEGARAVAEVELAIKRNAIENDFKKTKVSYSFVQSFCAILYIFTFFLYIDQRVA